MSYEVGDQDVDRLNNSWTAVYVSGGWRFVFPLWAFSAVVGHSKGTWTLVETQGMYTTINVMLSIIIVIFNLIKDITVNTLHGS